MTPFSSDNLSDTYEDRMERAIFRAGDLYDLDGETFFRSRNGEIETGNWEVAP